MKNPLPAIILSVSLFACGGGSKPDKIDLASLTAGGTASAKLSFAMLEKGMRGGGLADEAMFDDAANHRAILFFDPTLKDKVAKLEKGKIYNVTFKVEKPGDFIEGTLTSVE